MPPLHYRVWSKNPIVSQRRLLAAKAKKLGRTVLRKLDTVVSPDTLLRWYRQLVAAKYDGSSRRPNGRPPVAAEIDRLIPHGEWMEQVARNLTDAFDGFLLGTRYIILDRDPLFTSTSARSCATPGPSPCGCLRGARI